MKRTIGLVYLCVLLFLLGWIRVDAQRTAQYTTQASKLKQELLQAQKLRQPKTALDKAQSLMRLAERNRQLSDLLLALVASRDANRSISTDHDAEVFVQLARVAQLSWLNPEERSLLSAVTHSLYEDY